MRSMRSLVGAAVAALALTTMLGSPARAGTGGLVIIGDSIAGGDLDSYDWLWPKAVSSSAGLEVTRYAEAGSGIVKAGARCAGTTYAQRLDAIASGRPSVLVVEDGIGDALRCSNRTYVRATPPQAKVVIDAFMRDLAIRVQRSGLARSKVIVMSPTSFKVRGYEWMRDQIEVAAHRHGFTYIQPYLTVNQTVDGFHPNQAGHLVLTQALLKAMKPPRTKAAPKTKPKLPTSP